MMRFLPVNLNALLVELDDLAQTLTLLASLQNEPLAGIEELVPAARTLLVHFRPAAVSHAELIERIGRRNLTKAIERVGTLVEIPVDYHGEDLDEVAQLLQLTREDVIALHTGREYSVAFTGFAPGFAYLSGGHPRLNVARRATPRTRIPAGAVGLAGLFSGVYPRASPGGWQIIGVTATPMWDLSRAVPALLQPGFKVRFIDAARRPRSTAITVALQVKPAAAPVLIQADGAALEIRRTGLQALFQDLGRYGQVAQGVSASGAMDQGALRAANRLVGNPGNSACVEIVGGGFEFVCRGDVVIAITGAELPIHLTAGRDATSPTNPTTPHWAVPGYQPIALSDGDRLTLGEPRAGVRSYLAVRGGFRVDPVLGSCSTDTLAGLGPAPLAVGDVLAVTAVTRGAVVGSAEQPPADLPTTAQIVVLDVVMGPRTDWYTPEAVELLARQLWTVTPQSNRVGLRLQGDQPLTRADLAELPSEGTALGAIQVPPNGQPVLFLADHPLTGGYPVIGAVAPHHLDRAGQIPVHAQVRFNPIRLFDF